MTKQATEEFEQEIIETGEVEEARMVLGDREKIRYAGVIRAGVKLPKNSCTAAEKEKFRMLEAEGLPYDDIDKQLGGTPKSGKSKLFPSNADHFIIRECDYNRPADAQYILKEFAGDDGKVRRIPVWFPVDDINVAIPHGFMAFDGSSSVRASSYYEGDTLMLKYVSKDKNILVPKKGDWVSVPFDPDAPPSDAPSGIDFCGMYRVYIPGIKGLSEIIVPTKSWYGLGDAVAVLRRARSIRGRFNGLLDGKPFLELCKVQQTVKAPDGKKQKQWIITLECSVDAAELERDAGSRVVRGKNSMQLLNGRRPATTLTAAMISNEAAALDAAHIAAAVDDGPTYETDEPAHEEFTGEPVVAHLISPAQAEEIDKKIQDYGVDYGRFLQFLGVQEIWQIEQASFGTAIAALENKRRQNEAKQAAAPAKHTTAAEGEQPSLLGGTSTGAGNSGAKNMNSIAAELAANKISCQMDESSGTIFVKLNATDTISRDLVKGLGFRWDGSAKRWYWQKAAA